jgi:hypothetical protein
MDLELALRALSAPAAATSVAGSRAPAANGPPINIALPAAAATATSGKLGHVPDAVNLYAESSMLGPIQLFLAQPPYK